MKKLVEPLLEDRSTADRFLFRIRCGVCGRSCSAGPVGFSRAGVRPATEQKQVLFDILYRQEHADARSRAVRQVAEMVNLCPLCGRIVCNRCFWICEDLDLCRECAAAAGETGVSVDSGDPAGPAENPAFPAHEQRKRRNT